MFDTVPTQASTRLRMKYAVFAVIGAMIAYVLFHNEIFLIQPANPHWQHYQALGLWLLVHGVAGGSALILAPMQFSDRLRMRFTKLHRVSGRIYVTGALGGVVVSGAAYMYVCRPQHRMSGLASPKQGAVRSTYIEIVETGLSELGPGFRAAYDRSSDAIPQHLVIQDRK